MYRTYTSALPRRASARFASSSGWSDTGHADSVLARITTGEARAVADCLDRYRGLVWSLVRLRVRNPADAEDAVQEIFVELWKSAARFDARIGSEAVFVATIARRKLIDQMRARAREPSLESFDEGAFETEACTGVEIASSADLDTAARALGQLAPDQRELVMMGVVQGLSHSEIARATGKPLGTVKARMRRGLAKVREMLVGARASGVRFVARRAPNREVRASSVERRVRIAGASKRHSPANRRVDRIKAEHTSSPGAISCRDHHPPCSLQSHC